MKRAMDDLLELDRIVLRLRLEGGSSNGRTAAMLGLEQEIVDVSLLRRMHRVLERRRPDARRRITPQGAELGPSTGLTDSLVGRTLSRYRVLDLIGFGGMGVARSLAGRGGAEAGEQAYVGLLATPGSVVDEHGVPFAL